MSFWVDVKKVYGVAVETLNHVSSLGFEAAEKVRNSAEVMEVRSRVMLLEAELERPELLSISSIEKDEKRVELLEKYDELARLAGGEVGKDALLKKKRLLAGSCDDLGRIDL